MVGIEQAAVEVAIGIGSAAGTSGIAWYLMQRWMDGTESRIKAVEDHQAAMPEACATKMGAVYERIERKCSALDKKIDDQEDCVEGELLKVNDKLGNLNLNVTKIVTVMSMQAKDPGVREILNSENP